MSNFSILLTCAYGLKVSIATISFFTIPCSIDFFNSMVTNANLWKETFKRSNFWDGILGHQVNKSLESFARCYSQFLLLAEFKKIILFSDFKNPYKKNLRNKKSRVNSWIAFCRTEKWGYKTRQKLESEKTQLYAKTPQLKNSISG